MIKYRIATIDDAENLLTTRYNAVVNNGTTKYPMEVLLAWAPQINDGTISAEKEMIKNADRITVVAEDCDDTDARKMIGLCTVDVSKESVTQCYVVPGYAKQGIGTNLMNKIEAIAKEKGVKKLQISSSLIASEFQKARGFKALNMYDYDLGNNLFITCYMMEKEL